jgi:hypothetical protein
MAHGITIDIRSIRQLKELDSTRKDIIDDESQDNTHSTIFTQNA